MPETTFDLLSTDSNEADFLGSMCTRLLDNISPRFILMIASAAFRYLSIGFKKELFGEDDGPFREVVMLRVGKKYSTKIREG